jgi:hypothetical protein
MAEMKGELNKQSGNIETYAQSVNEMRTAISHQQSQISKYKQSLGEWQHSYVLPEMQSIKNTILANL